MAKTRCFLQFRILKSCIDKNWLKPGVSLDFDLQTTSKSWHEEKTSGPLSEAFKDLDGARVLHLPQHTGSKRFAVASNVPSDLQTQDLTLRFVQNEGPCRKQQCQEAEPVYLTFQAAEGTASQSRSWPEGFVCNARRDY